MNYAAASMKRPGDLIECGVCEGGVSLMLASTVKARRVEKTVLMFDTFSGLPKPNVKIDKAPHEHVSNTKEVVHLGPVGQATVIKGLTTLRFREYAKIKFESEYGGHTVALSTKHLRTRLRSYCRSIQEFDRIIRKYREVIG